MFGLVSQIKYNQLDKKYVSTQKELDDIKANCILIRKSDMDALMSDVKKLETDNEILRKQINEYRDIVNKIVELKIDIESLNFNSEEYSGPETTAYWIKKEGKPLICSNCGNGLWNATGNFITHCDGCGRRMTKIEYIK